MRKSVIILSSMALLLMSFWQVHSGSTSMSWLLATNPNYNLIRIMIGLLLVGYVYLPDAQQYMTRWVIRSIGIILLTIGCSGLLYLTYNDSRGLSMYPLDIISLVESAILAVFVSITVPGTVSADNQSPENVSQISGSRKLANTTQK